MRRTFRRHIRRTLSQNVPPILQEANFAFDKGEYGRAAELYENIARTADARGSPRASLFHLQAGRARIHADQVTLGIPSLKRGLELFAQRGQLAKLNHYSDRVIAELKEHHLDDEAGEMESMLRRLAPPMPAFEAQKVPPGAARLPARCPACGAQLRPDEVEWFNETIAECAYCGSPVQ